MVKEKYLPYKTPETPAFTTPDYATYHTTYEYDIMGRLIKAINPDGTFITTEYNLWTTTDTDANGHITRSTVDAFGRLVKKEEINGNETYVTEYTYDALGDLVQTKDNHGNIVTIYYDSLGRKTAMDDPDMGHWKYEYDYNGNLISQTDGKGQVLEFTYDALNRLTKKSSLRGSGATEAISVKYFYDDISKPNCVGRLSKVEYEGGSSEFFYDNLGREIKSVKVVDGKTYTVERTYDDLNRLATVKYPDDEVITYTYNRAGGIQKVEGDSVYVNKIDYNDNGQMTFIEYGNGASTDYTYNPQTLRLTSLVTDSPAEPDGVQNLSYGFDSVGNVASITDTVNNSSQSFQYDDLDRLIYANGGYGEKTYAYDSIGNMVKKGDLTMYYGEGAGPHAVTSTSNGEAVLYDKNGNMATNGTSTYRYDYENRLIEANADSSELYATVTINLKPGWNFFSLPVIPDNLNISSVLSSLALGTDYEQVSRYNPSTDKFESYAGDPDYDQFDRFEYLKGYQIYITNPNGVTLSIRGRKQSSDEYTYLESGWNLIGSPTRSSKPILEVLESLEFGTDYDMLIRYNSSNSQYEKFQNNLTLDDFVNFDAGYAYFIYCLRDLTLTVKGEVSDVTTFSYDGDGGRTLRKSAGSTTLYIGSLYEVNNGIQTKHIFLGSNRICSVTNPSLRGSEATEAISYYHQDHLGSSNVITDNDGKITQVTEYTPYGEVYSTIGENVTSYLFTGKELDSTTGLYYYGARYYNPFFGRFITADPTIQHPYDPQDFNRYSYVRNNPVNYVDPTGHSWKSFWKRWGGFFGAFTKAVFTGDWKSFGNVMIATATAFVFSGFNPIVAAATYMTESVMDTEAGWRATEGVGKGLFDNVFGMRPGTAYIWSSITLRIAVNYGFERMFANMVGTPVKAKDFDPAKNSFDGATNQEKAFGADANHMNLRGGENKFTALMDGDTQVGTIGVSRFDKMMGVNVKALEVTHTGINIQGYTGGKINSAFYGSWGVCHTAVNSALLKAGYSSTLISLGQGGWSTFLSTAVYGNYVGGLYRSAYAGYQSYNDYDANK